MRLLEIISYWNLRASQALARRAGASPAPRGLRHAGKRLDRAPGLGAIVLRGPEGPGVTTPLASSPCSASRASKSLAMVGASCERPAAVTRRLLPAPLKMHHTLGELLALFRWARSDLREFGINPDLTIGGLSVASIGAMFGDLRGPKVRARNTGSPRSATRAGLLPDMRTAAGLKRTPWSGGRGGLHSSTLAPERLSVKIHTHGFITRRRRPHSHETGRNSNPTKVWASISS